MTLFILLAVLLSTCLWLRRPCLEITLGSLFAAPLLVLAAGQVIGFEGGSALLVFFLALGITYYVTKGSEDTLPAHQERYSALALFLSYLVFYRLSLLWPDFISIGERLRDYAILAATYRNPVDVPEPWMSGVALNYYVYWYRFGQFIGAIFNEPVWAIYHQLAAFSLAAYFACCFRLLITHLNFSPLASFFGATVVACGSNFSGVQYFLTRDANWWGPSRVIEGGINEFPAWSFLLGDLHPHYLNLCVLPLMTSIVLLLVRGGWSASTLLKSVLVWGLLLPCWLFAANAWEIPVWGIFSAWLLIGFICSIVCARVSIQKNQSPRSPLSSLAATVLISGLGFTLWWSTWHLKQPDQFDLEWVVEPVLRSPLIELLMHWGIPLCLMALATLIAERNRIMALSGLALLVLGALFAPPLSVPSNRLEPVALLPLALLGIILLTQRSTSFFGLFDKNLSSRGSDILAFALPLSFLSVIIFPEIAFVNDAYGSDIERMNTIFKFYSAAWWMGWLSLFIVGREALDRLSPAVMNAFSCVPRWVAYSLALVLLCGFFYRTIQIRRTERFTVTPFSQGLSTLDQRFPGSAETIKKLSAAQNAIVLEAQGNAYDVTTFVATLSGQQSFLGWGNHVGLLTNKYDEVRRREEFTEAWYREADCEKRKSMLLNEGITHAVIGSLEKQRYGEDAANNVACLNEFSLHDQYKVVTP